MDVDARPGAIDALVADIDRMVALIDEYLSVEHGTRESHDLAKRTKGKRNP